MPKSPRSAAADPLLPPPLQQVDRVFVRAGGRKLLYFAGCDYFRLASHPEVLAAVRDGLERFGLNVAASRRTTGQHALYDELERALAKFFGAEAAVLTSSGYATNLVLAPVAAAEFSHALISSRAHASLRDAAALWGARAKTFPHRDVAAVARAARRLGPRAKILLLTDGFLAQDGDVAPLREYLAALPPTAALLVDDAHAAGILGANGRGSLEETGLGRARALQTVTLSKAFGVYGGAILCPRAWREKIMRGSPHFIGNTPLPPPLAAGALAAVRLLRAHPEWRARLRATALEFKLLLRTAGLDLAAGPGPVFALAPDGAGAAEKLRRALLRAGIHPPFIRYPGGPATGCFRFALSSEHTTEQLGRLAETLMAWRAGLEK